MHKALYATSVKHNGNRTKWTPFWCVIIRAINKIGRTRLTVLDDSKSYYQLIITVRNFRKKIKQIHLGQTIAVETMSKEKKFFFNLEIPQFLFFFFFRVSNCFYGYRDQYCDWWI